MFRKVFLWEALVFCLLLDIMPAHSQIHSCSPHTCRPPKCRCPAHAIPGNLRPEQVPQMVLIAFDDAVNWENWHYYLRLFPPDGSRKNPNGCPISATFFVSHNFTDYCMVRKLHARGMEIGDHSVTHKLPRNWWTDADREKMAHEVLTQRRHLVEKAHIPSSDIKGWRSPFLQPAGDDLFSILSENNFTYDATMTYSFPKNLYSPVLWPFTLDFGYTLVCNIARCPQQSYPGFWIVPVVILMDYREQKPCAYVDDCANMPRDQHDAYQMLWKNFLRNYRSNRAPLYLNLHSPWLNTDFHLEAMDQFIQKMVDMDDVYLVTVNQALEWQMNPTPLNRLQDFAPWQCPGFEPYVEDRKMCSFVYKHKAIAADMPTLPPYHNNEDKTSGPRDQPQTDVISGSYETPKEKKSETNKKLYIHENDEEDSDENQTPRTEDSKTNDVKTDSTDVSGIKHHHNEKTHRPWFLKNGSSTTSLPAFIISLSFISSLHVFLRAT